MTFTLVNFHVACTVAVVGAVRWGLLYWTTQYIVMINSVFNGVHKWPHWP